MCDLPLFHSKSKEKDKRPVCTLIIRHISFSYLGRSISQSQILNWEMWYVVVAPGSPSLYRLFHRCIHSVARCWFKVFVFSIHPSDRHVFFFIYISIRCLCTVYMILYTQHKCLNHNLYFHEYCKYLCNTFAVCSTGNLCSMHKYAVVAATGDWNSSR